MLFVETMNRAMNGKKSEPLTIKLSDGDKDRLREVSLKHDRPLGYVARELMLRGLEAYGRDGLLKEPEKNVYARPLVKVKTEDKPPKEQSEKRRA